MSTTTTTTKAVKTHGYNCVNCKSPLKTERTLCGACRGVYYCSKSCQINHWRQNHKIACQLYKHILAKDVYSDLPDFEFPLKVKPGKMDEWLNQYGVKNKGIWRRENSESAKFAYGLLPAAEEDSIWGLASEHLPAPLAKPLPEGQTLTYPSEPLKGWADYYQLRGLSLKSPVAVVLSVPLTLYYIITQVIPNHKRIKGKKHLEIFIVGPDRELDQLAVFEELAYLIPEVSFHFVLVGPSVPSDIKYQSKNSRCTFSFRRSFYHELKGLSQQPDLVYAPNAGLETDETLRPTVVELTKQKVPSFFSETCETATLNATRLFATAGAKEGFPVRLNPFRSPVWKEADVHAMPLFDYAYLQSINL